MPASSSKVSIPCRISAEVRDRTDTRMFGCAAVKGAVRSATMGKAVGITPSRTTPDSPWCTERISERIARTSPKIRRAQSSTRWPSGVRPWNRLPR